MTFHYGDPLPDGPLGYVLRALLNWYEQDFARHEVSFEIYATEFIFSLAMEAAKYWSEKSPSQQHLDHIRPYFGSSEAYSSDVWDLLHYVADHFPSTLYSEEFMKGLHSTLARSAKIRAEGIGTVHAGLNFPFRVKAPGTFGGTRSARWIDEIDQRVSDLVDRVVATLTSRGITSESVDQEINLRRELTHMIGWTFRQYALAQMHPEAQRKLALIIARKEADDDFLSHWMLDLHWNRAVHHFLDRVNLPADEVFKART